VIKRTSPTHGVLIAGVHLTYPSRSTANRVRRALRAYLVALPLATRADLEAVAKLAARMDGHEAADIAATAAGRHLPAITISDRAMKTLCRGIGLTMAEVARRMKGKIKPCR